MKKKTDKVPDDWEDIDSDGLLWRSWQFGKAAQNPIPDTPGILQAIVRALLDRVEEKDRKSGAWCRWIVRRLAVQDRCSLDSGNRDISDLLPEIGKLRSGRPHGCSHIYHSGELPDKEIVELFQKLKRLDAKFSVDQIFDAYGLYVFDPIPETPLLLREIVCALLARIEWKDRKSGAWCRWIVQCLAARDRLGDDRTIHSIPGACPELEELSSGKPRGPGHNAGLIRAQYAWLNRYYFVQEQHHSMLAEIGVSVDFSLSSWFDDWAEYIHESLSVYACMCTYERGFEELQLLNCWGRRTAFLEILGALHRVKPIVIESLLKPSNRSRLHTPPPLFLR